LSRPSKRAEILRAGVEVLHKRGYGAASVESITDAAGVPKGSFFNHFHSKEQFAKEALDAYFLPWSEKSQALLGRTDLSAKEKLVELLQIATGKAKGCYDGCLIGNFSLELANESDSLRLQLSQILDAWSSSFETVIREGQTTGFFEPSLAPGKAARFVVNLFQGAILRAKVERSIRATEEFEDFVLSTLEVRSRYPFSSALSD
jgi:TetR/AcrR family transcriptional repressor of nem operon